MTSPPSVGYEDDAQLVRAALAAAGVDARDFGNFVNRAVPGVTDPVHFDAARAMPVLVKWLPRVSNEKVREAIVRHLAVKTADSRAADALIEEYRRPGSQTYKWAVAATLAYICGSSHFAKITDLVADRSQGIARQPLIGMLWRVKTAAADEILHDALSDPDTALAAMSALRRRLGNADARQYIETLLNDPDQRVSRAARRQLQRIDKGPDQT
jgi:HEAT repeat protein